MYALYVCRILPLETFGNGPARLTRRHWFFMFCWPCISI